MLIPWYVNAIIALSCLFISVRSFIDSEAGLGILFMLLTIANLALMQFKRGLDKADDDDSQTDGH